MIDTSTWRFRIGVYSGGKRLKQKNQERTTSIGECNANTRIGLSTIVAICALCFLFQVLSEICITFINMHKTLATDCFKTHVNPFIAYLLIIGGVETNPGPKSGPDSKSMHNLFRDEQQPEHGEPNTNIEDSDAEMEVESDHVTTERKRRRETTDSEEPLSKQLKHSAMEDETKFSTNFISMKIMSDKTNKIGLYRDPFLQNICALANSVGGVLQIEKIAAYGSKQKDAKFSDFDGIMEKGKEWINEIGHSGFEHLIDFKPPIKEHENFLLVFVHGSDRLVTTCMNTYDTHFKKKEYCLKTENMMKIIKDIGEQESIKYKTPKPNPVSVIKGELIHYQQRPSESHCLEYKSCENTKNLKTLLNKLSEKNKKDTLKLAKYVCIFTKNDNGGSIIYGITESGKSNKIYRVEGINCPIAKKDEIPIEAHCRKEIKTNTLWLTYNGKILESEKIDEYIRVIFHPIKFAGITGNIKLLEIAVASFHGIVFSSPCGPEAWSMNPISGKVSRLEILDWYRHMRKYVFNADPKLLSEKLSKLKIERSSIKDERVFELENSISQIQKKVFRREVDLCFMPDVLIENVCERDSRFEVTMEKIRKFYIGETGVVVADRRFLSVINKNCKDISVCKTCHLCDFLIISTAKPVVFLSIVAFDDSESHSMCEQQIKQYCHQSAKIVKLTLAQYTNKKFVICQGLMNLKRGNVEETLEKIIEQYEYYPDSFRKHHTHKSLERSRIFEICKALTLASSIIPSSFQFSIGETFIESLTNETFSVTLNEKQQHFIWKTYDCDAILGVNGFPGTGKTYVAKAFLQKLINQGADLNSILFFAKEIPLCEHIRKLFGVVTLTYDELISEYEKDQHFGKNIKYIIVDDAQLIEGVIIMTRHKEKLYKWYYILRNIYYSQKKGERKFVIFYGSHHYKREVKELTKLVDFDLIQHFTEIVRNSRSIAEFAAKRMSNIDYQMAVDNIGHKFKGDGVKQKPYQLQSEQDYIDAIDNELHDLQAMNVRYGDIAVLFMNIDDIPESLNCISIERMRVKNLQYTCRLELQEKSFKFPKCGKVNVCSGEQNENKTHLVVDSVRGYSSLERPVVIGVGVGKNFKSPNEKLQGLCYTRPLVKLIIIKDINTV